MPSLSGALKDLLSDKQHKKNLCIAIVQWVSNLLSYYTVYFNIRHLNGDYFFNTLAFGACELAAYGFGAYLTSKFGLKVSLQTSFTLTFAATILYLLVKDDYAELLPIVLAIAGFGIIWGCNNNWNGNATLFPVIYASSTNGIC